MLRIALLLTTHFAISQSTISPAFQAYVRQNYPANFNQVARLDLGVQGSYGGGNHVPGTKTRNTPVVIVHGMATTAGTTQPARAYFLSRRYADEEVYATTYADGRNYNGPLSCEYVKAVRALIIIASAYTGSQVNVIAYSLGVPISRKALLGGPCADTNENLGPALTSHVKNFVGVVGPNFGVPSCTGTAGQCNLINGLNCRSRYISDINGRQRYEASTGIYSILSTNDAAVGYNVCGLKTGVVPGSNGVYEQSTGHVQTCFATIPMQFNLVTYNRP
ncbi:Protein LIPS-17 [Aphelenchoides avenae]|nr:Protein LIPS-17 [Aphelenchus avenae]